jgi:hypothetical protein
MTGVMSPSPSPAGRRRSWFRRDPVPDDSVIIGAESSYAWWADRDELVSARSPRHDAAEAIPQAFAPASDTSPPNAPSPPADEAPEGNRWDVDSLFEWAATTGTVGEAPPHPDEVPLSWLVFGLTPAAEWEEVVSRHRVLAKRYHPDLHADSDEHTRAQVARKMVEVNYAFSDLMGIYGVRRGA